MPRNGSGTFSVPNSFSSNTTIESAKVNQNFSDVGSEITGSLPRSGEAGMSGQFKAADGTSGAPGITYASDPDLGFYRVSSNVQRATGTLQDSIGTVIVGIPTGVILPYGATTSPTGWVRCNARTIGNSSSSATERANADTENLFTFLWTNYSDTVCPVSTGRGASAAADYAANKTIGLPDVRGRGLFGLDDMGNSAAGRLAGATIDQTTNGATGGADTVTLASANLPVHTHTFSATTSGQSQDHTHNLTAVPGPGSIRGGGASDDLASETTITTSGTSQDHNHTVNGTTGNGGFANTAVDKLPPAFLTTFIIKL
jgi:microcystin-dependent protein